MRPLNAPTEPYHFVCLITVKPALLDSSFFVRSLLAQLELRDNRFRTITTLSTTSKARDSSRKTAICNMYWPAPSTCYIQIERNDRNENVWKLNARGDENENGKKDSRHIEHLCANVNLENLHSKAFTLIKIALHNNRIEKSSHYL